MTDPLLYPVSGDSFAQILGDVAQLLEPERRLPDWPFKVPVGNADVCQFSLAIEGPFGSVLQHLVDAHGDARVSFAVLDPTPDYYRESYGSYPGFTLSGPTIARTYWDAVAHEPGDDPTGSAAYTANVVGIVGSSGEWAVWAERSWDIAIVLTQRSGGTWLSAGVDFVSVETALADFTEPDFKVPLSDRERTSFVANMRTRGVLT
ncbi:hypothetical protein KV097_14440 [Mumia sp. zg.B17]|uniref:hypothetical protein n=1 Tax=Mumia sp. zg.B17 TaxID=2855446 RepID=UPI001C6F0C43|nr:hypothetical protein [Mumia sp. zg.B17]MBW9207142.1 hypothetical protein [Mumia sp. zg.B17]